MGSEDYVVLFFFLKLIGYFTVIITVGIVLGPWYNRYRNWLDRKERDLIERRAIKTAREIAAMRYRNDRKFITSRIVDSVQEFVVENYSEKSIQSLIDSYNKILKQTTLRVEFLGDRVFLLPVARSMKNDGREYNLPGRVFKRKQA